jgi:DNA end-binding protein Ku
MTDEDFDFSKYRNGYTDKLTQLIEAKMAGKEIVAPPAAAEVAPVANLMEALQKSLAAAKKTAGGKPPKLTAPSASPVAAKAGRKRKTS